MSAHDFTQLFDQYPVVISLMKEKFKSHEFILKLAETNQAAYIDALHSYRDNGRPFLTVHGQLAKHLGELPALVTHLDEVDSKDIFRNSNRCGYWKRVNAT